MRWTTKALIQRTLAQAPAGKALYYLGQRSVGGFRCFTIDSKVRQGLSLLSCLQELGEGMEDQVTVEIGTGWAPILPLLFWLKGQKECHTYDVSRLLKESLLLETAKQLVAPSRDQTFLPGEGAGKEHFQARRDLLREMVQARASGSEILRRCGIRYHAPVDAAATRLPDRSVDLVYSNTVLEHVSPSEIDRLFAESYRVLRPGGRMLHLIDLSDHFSHADPGISTINFLQFSERTFSRYNTPFLFQNRLRPPAWREIICGHGFEIVYWKTVLDERALQQLPSLQLDGEFLRLDPKDLCATAIRVVARRT